MFSSYSLTGLMILLINGLLLQTVFAGIGLKPLDFFRFSDEDLGKEVKVIFHPDEGLRLREKFEKKYGTRGTELIKSLGEGQVFAGNNVNVDT